MKIHFISHHFSEWDSQTKHMNRLEKSIFMDLRTLYFSNATANNGKIDATEIELLHYRLACHSEQEQQALARLLKDQFKKIGKTYRNSDWDNQIKNIIWAMNNGKYGNEMGNEVGNGLNNEMGNGGNETGNALSNAERQAKTKAERKKLLADLADVGIKLDKNAKIADIREQHKQHCQQPSNETGNELNNKMGNSGNGLGNETGNASNAQNQANIITINQDQNQNQNQNQEREQKSENPQNLTAHTQRNLNSITHWQAPTLDEIRSILLANGFAGVFTQEIYDQILPKFKNHFENLEITENKRLATEQSRIDRLVAWIKRERQIANLSDNTPTTTPAKKPIDPSQIVMINGLPKPIFPKLNQEQTYFLVTKSRKPGESTDETYDRLATQTDWTAFDYDGFNQRYTISDKAVA